VDGPNEKLGTQMSITSPCHQQADPVERTIQTIETVFGSGELPVSLSGLIEQSDNTKKVFSIVDE
jgi:hypothetical protein